MKKYIKIIFALAITAIFTTACDKQEDSFADEIFNDDNNYPYVSIQDVNEEIAYSGTGNNFWGFELVAENDGNQVRIIYRAQDPNIVNHQVYVGFDNNDSTAPLDSDVLIETITTFPTELVFTKEDVAAALGVPVTDLETGSVYFRGRSIDEDGNVVEDPSVFELFLTFERHAYFYEWPLDQ